MENHYIFALCVAISCLAYGATLVESANAGGGEVCKVDTDCLPNSFLYCNQKDLVCACVLGVDLIFNPVSKTCERAIGSNCNLEPAANEPLCSTNSTCREFDWESHDGKCSCDYGLKRNGTTRICSISIANNGEDCGPEGTPETSACVENSACTLTGEKHICTCNEGFETAEDFKACINNSGTVLVSIPFASIVFQLLFVMIH